MFSSTTATTSTTAKSTVRPSSLRNHRSSKKCKKSINVTVRFNNNNNNNNNITTTIVVIAIALTINLPFLSDQILPNLSLSLPLFTSERAFDIASYSHAINGITIVM
jgi:hypothetical protein